MILYSNILKTLRRPAAYLTIRHEGSGMPFFVNWVLPIIFSIIFTSAIVFAPIQINVWGESGLVTKLLGFFQSLPGFYIAALAAIATFGANSMDRIMPGTPPTMDIYRNGVMERNQSLTRRLFLSSMFSYLTALSIFLTLASIFGVTFAGAIKPLLSSGFVLFLKIASTGIFLALAAQLISVTLWGLYYLGERIHLS